MLLSIPQILSFAQEKDFEVWTGVEVSKSIGKKIEIDLEEEFRFNENSTSFDLLFTDISATYKYNKHIRLSVQYRFIKKHRQEGYFSNQHRYDINLILRHKIERFTFSLRNKYETKYSDILTDELGRIPDYYLRNKLSIEYNVRKSPITPFVACESYLPLNKNESREIKKARYTIGAEYKLNKRNQIECFYRIEKEYNVNNPKTSFIAGLSYSYDLR